MSRRSEFYFLVVNDLHFQESPSDAWLASLVSQMNGQPEQPELCLVLGDLVEDGTREQLLHVREALEGLAMPYRVAIGNHDYAPGDDRGAWDAVFPGPCNYEFEHQGWRFIGLDTTAGVAYQETEIPEETLAWVERTLADLDRAEPKIVFTHFPLGEGVRFRPVNAEALLRRLEGQNVRAVFSGHYHGATEMQWGEIPLVTSRCPSALRENHDGSPEKGYLLCRVTPERIERTFVPVRL